MLTFILFEGLLVSLIPLTLLFGAAWVKLVEMIDEYIQRAL
jgi:hypothetical protein